MTIIIAIIISILAGIGLNFIWNFFAPEDLYAPPIVCVPFLFAPAVSVLMELMR
jgi:hypothetical protein